MTLRISVPDERYFPVFDGLDVEALVWNLDGPAPRRDIDMVIGPAFRTPDMWRWLETVDPCLVQLNSIGYDGIAENAPAGFRFANATSVHETATAELTLAAVLAVARDIPFLVRNQIDHVWRRRMVRGLADSTVLLIGAGGVGSAIADRLRPFEVDLVRVATRARDDERGHVHAITELAELLPQADIVIVVVPLTEATHHMVNDSFLGHMKDGAMFVNVARGPVADSDALVKHADRLNIVLDVTEPEPLDPEHPLWDAAALVLPHVGGASKAQFPRRDILLHEQIRRLQEGNEPLNIVYES